MELESLQTKMEIDPANVTCFLTEFIATKVEELEREGVILGLSGGVDSAVVAALCRKAVDPDKITALIMPEKDSQQEHLQDALSFAANLGIKAKIISLTSWLKQAGAYRLFAFNKLSFLGKFQGRIIKSAYNYYRRKTGETPFASSLLGLKDKDFASYLKTGNAYYRLKHRLRMALLYFYGELENKLIVGAANKTEYKIGFFVKYGCDDAADIMPLLGLYKTQVRALARYLEIPEHIINKAPSPDILPGINDEEAIGIPYEELDLILLALEMGLEDSEISKVLTVTEGKVRYVKSLMQRSAHMRQIYSPEL